MSLLNFSQMIFNLESKTGLSGARIAKRVGIPATTLNSWKNGEVDPRFSHGVALLDYYVTHCGTDIPRLSAADTYDKLDRQEGVW